MSAESQTQSPAPHFHGVKPPAEAAVERPAAEPAPAGQGRANADRKSTSGTEPDSSQRVLWMSRADQWFLAAVVGTALVLMLVHWVRLSGWGSEVVEIDRQNSRWREYRVDINSANWIEWTQLEGIGQTMAERIVADREANGPFRDFDDLQRVKGIGPKTVERLRPWLRMGAEPAPPP